MIALQSSDVRPGSGGFTLPHHPQPRLQHLAHGVDPGAQGRVNQVSVALGGTDLGVAEEAADHFQRSAAGDEQGREGVAQVARQQAR